METQFINNRVQSLPPQNQTVFRIVEAAKQDGILKTQIKKKSGMASTLLDKILQTLSQQGLLKNIKTSHSKGKNIWLRSDIDYKTEVHKSWHQGKHINKQLIKKIETLILKKLQKHPTPINQLIQQLAIKESLIQEEVLQIVKSLIYFRKIQEREDRLNVRQQHNMISVNLPCINCPVFDQCGKNQFISPENCQFLIDF